MKREKGITIIALVITVIVLLILAGISVTGIFGEEGIITTAQLAAFSTEMQQIREKVEIKKVNHAAASLNGSETEGIFTEKFNGNEIKILDSLKREILFTRENYPEGKTVDDYEVEEFEKLVDGEGNIDGIYVIDQETGNEKANTYIYDKETNVIYKIPATKIGGKTYHTYELASTNGEGIRREISNEEENNDKEEERKKNVVEKESEIVQVGNEYYYGPNMKEIIHTWNITTQQMTQYKKRYQ